LPVSLTRAGWSLAGAAAGLVVGGYLLGTVALLVLGVAAALLIGCSAAWLATRPAPPVVASRRAHPDRFHVGTDGRIDLTVENAGSRPTPLLGATDWFDEGRRAARFLVPALLPGGVARAAYRVPTRRRGRYTVGPLVVWTTDPFGLARRRIDGAGVAELTVRPRVHDIVAPVAVGTRVAAESDAPGARAIASDLGDEFLTLRDYEVGDDLRRVHWKSSARRDQLVIRQNEARWRSRAVVVLDVDELAYDADSFELAVEAVASVVARLVRLRRRVEVVTTTGEVLGTGGDARHDVIDRLATIGPAPDADLAGVLAGVRAHRQVDLVVAVVGTLTPRAADVLRSLGSVGVVVVLTRPGAVGAAPGVVVVDASRAPFAGAWNAALTYAHPRSAARPWSRARA
jgi:uncharacterized protein (DUF58 family)